MKRVSVLLLVMMLIAPGLTPAQIRVHRIRHRPGNQFRRMDLNGDGRISRDEWRRRPRRFDRLDLNRDGYITRDEMREARRLRRVRR
ncbi:MAG TPA: hypothetical protein VFD58_28265 [Blastocatellia bacterium]|nr:hypothetical protein [Blastocatellia bacterium]